MSGLTPAGAQLLRKVREHITQNPETFDWSSWCGSRCCIAGHINMLTYGNNGFVTSGDRAAIALGFVLPMGGSAPEARELFYGWTEPLVGGPINLFDATDGVRAINRFLTKWGYPINAVQEQEALELCCA